MELPESGGSLSGCKAEWWKLEVVQTKVKLPTTELPLHVSGSFVDVAIKKQTVFEHSNDTLHCALKRSESHGESFSCGNSL